MEQQHSNPTVNINALLGRKVRAERHLQRANEDRARWQRELEAVQNAYAEADRRLSEGTVSSGDSHSRFDRFTLDWTVNPGNLRSSMVPGLWRMLCLVFCSLSAEQPEGSNDINAIPEMKRTMTGEEFRLLIETKYPTRSTKPMRMFHVHRTDLIQRGILRIL